MTDGSKALRRKEHEEFALGVAFHGLTNCESYVRAFHYEEKGSTRVVASACATKLIRDPAVAARIAYLQPIADRERLEQLKSQRDWFMQKLRRDYETALVTGNKEDETRAIILIGQTLGLLPKKLQPKPLESTRSKPPTPEKRTHIEPPGGTPEPVEEEERKLTWEEELEQLPHQPNGGKVPDVIRTRDRSPY